MVKQYSNTFMGKIRRLQGKERTEVLIKKYHTYNKEGRQAARDELKDRAKLGNEKAKMFLSKFKPRQKRKSSGMFGFGGSSNLLKDFGF